MASTKNKMEKSKAAKKRMKQHNAETHALVKGTSQKRGKKVVKRPSLITILTAMPRLTKNGKNG